MSRAKLEPTGIPIVKNTSLLLLAALSILCLIGLLNATYALAAGILWGFLFADRTKLPLSKYAGLLLKVAIVLLGLTLPILSLADTAKSSFLPTISLIALTLSLGLLLSKWLKIGSQQAWLISSGTAICGGSAIAAVGSSIQAEQSNLVISLAIVFILNAVALWVYPIIGTYLELSQYQFGLWAALGIHDTSSVVGAAAAYGQEALNIASTTKLARALWIIPVALFASMLTQKRGFKFDLPIFILLFIVASLIGSYFNSQFDLSNEMSYLKTGAKYLFALSLLWMGASLNKKAIQTIPIKSLVLGIILWLVVSVLSLLVVMNFY